MSYTNSYVAPEPSVALETELYGPNPYDINFVLPVHLATLETERVKLVPFIPSVHARHFWDKATQDADLFRYYPIHWSTYEDLLTDIERAVRRDPTNLFFAVIDKTKPDAAHPEFEGGSLAGTIGLVHASTANLAVEIAFVIVLPEFQRTHVASNAVGALLKYCLDLPTASPPGLGLRRVQWCTHTKNEGSMRLAERMGLKREGVVRWNWVLSPVHARDGKKARETDKWPDRPGRDTVLLSICWDDWEGGARELVQRGIDRKV